MASTHIEISSVTSRYSSEFRSLVDRLRDIQELSQKLKDIGDQLAAGADWTSLGTVLGVSAGDAETVYNLLAATNTLLQGETVSLLLDRLG